jgi:hypothetical protein
VQERLPFSNFAIIIAFKARIEGVHFLIDPFRTERKFNLQIFKDYRFAIVRLRISNYSWRLICRATIRLHHKRFRHTSN